MNVATRAVSDYLAWREEQLQRIEAERDQLHAHLLGLIPGHLDVFIATDGQGELRHLLNGEPANLRLDQSCCRRAGTRDLAELKERFEDLGRAWTGLVSVTIKKDPLFYEEESLLVTFKPA